MATRGDFDQQQSWFLCGFIGNIGELSSKTGIATNKSTTTESVRRERPRSYGCIMLYYPLVNVYVTMEISMFSG